MNTITIKLSETKKKHKKVLKMWPHSIAASNIQCVDWRGMWSSCLIL